MDYTILQQYTEHHYLYTCTKTTRPPHTTKHKQHTAVLYALWRNHLIRMQPACHGWNWCGTGRTHRVVDLSQIRPLAEQVSNQLMSALNSLNAWNKLLINGFAFQLRLRWAPMLGKHTSPLAKRPTSSSTTKGWQLHLQVPTCAKGGVAAQCAKWLPRSHLTWQIQHWRI